MDSSEDDSSSGSSDDDLARTIDRSLLYDLEDAINNGHVTNAGKFAAKLAKRKVNCQILAVEQKNEKQKVEKKISLRVTFEFGEETEEDFALSMSSDSTVKDLKLIIESRCGYEYDRQTVFFKDRMARNDGSRIDLFDYSSGAVVIIKKEQEKKVGIAQKVGKRPKSKGSKNSLFKFVEGITSQKKEKQIGWKCDSCTFVNTPTRPGCEICGTERPVGYVIPKDFEAEERKRMQMEKQQWAAYEREETLSRERSWRAYQRLEHQSLVRNVVAFECAICMDNVEPGKGVELRACLHHFCFQCLSESVNNCDDVMVKCPYKDQDYSCDCVLEQREIRELVSAETLERLIERSASRAEAQSKDSFHCKSLDCAGWCFFEDGVSNFDCPICGQDNCIPCAAIHQGVGCKEYQDRLATLARTDEEARRTKEGLEHMLTTGEAMRCPNCNVIIIKNGGCDGIDCRNCKVALCWATKGLRWGPKGHGDISGGCRCGANGRRCHPNCQNCH